MMNGLGFCLYQLGMLDKYPL